MSIALGLLLSALWIALCTWVCTREPVIGWATSAAIWLENVLKRGN